MARHLAKLFDSMASLKFKEDENGEATKVALGMFSKDKEYVDFDQPCECVGQVRIYRSNFKQLVPLSLFPLSPSSIASP